MNRWRALLEKELRQHAWELIALVAAATLGLLLLMSRFLLREKSLSLLESLVGFHWIVLLLAALVLSGRLVVAEYRGKTQLFLEALPIRRGEAILCKYFLGLVILLTISGSALFIVIEGAGQREVISSDFAMALSARSTAFVCAWWSFFFAMGLTGRFRIPIYVGIFFGMMSLEACTSFELSEFPPFALLSTRDFPVVREFPTADVLATLCIAACALCAALVLALIKEGSVAEELSRRMSQKEKVLIFFLFLVFLLGAAFLDERREKATYVFTHPMVLRSEALPIAILYRNAELREDAERLLSHLEIDLGELRTALGIETLPPLRISYSAALDARTFQDAELSKNEGILVRANFREREDWEPTRFSAHLLEQVLDALTDDRSEFEPKAWLRDGFARWWTSRGPSAALRDCSDLRLLRALWLTRHDGIEEMTISQWHRHRERHGETMSAALAYSGFVSLEDRIGREALLRLVRMVFGRAPSRDIYEYFYELGHPMPKLFREATGHEWESFLGTWNAHLEELRALPGCRRALALVPEGEAGLEVRSEQGSIRAIAYRFDFTRPPREGLGYSLLHARLPPLVGLVEGDELRRREHFWAGGAASAEEVLVGEYGEGSYLFAALEIEDPTLQCQLRLAAERLVLQ